MSDPIKVGDMVRQRESWGFDFPLKVTRLFEMSHGDCAEVEYTVGGETRTQQFMLWMLEKE